MFVLEALAPLEMGRSPSLASAGCENGSHQQTQEGREC
jgi:hypothetical protein